MNEFDQFVKHVLGIKHYARYTDDFVVISHDREYLQRLIPLLQNFLEKNLLLQIHPHKISIRKYSDGIDFLGYVILPHCRLIRKRTWKRIQRKFREKVAAYNNGKITRESLNRSLQSYLGILSHANTHELQELLINSILL